MKIASWNINSVRLRLPLVQAFMKAHPVDILCLQETKTPDEFFPHDGLKEIGYEHHLVRGEKSYNGVAIISKIPLTPMEHAQHGGNAQTRHIAAILPDGTELHNCYIPAGGDIADAESNPKFAHKLKFLEDLTQWSQQRKTQKNHAVILGDFNIAPLEHDVWSSKQLRKVVSHTPIEREKLNQLLKAGDWVDSHRHFVDAAEKLYSWWSYRARDWKASNKGRRLDHIWVSESLKPALKSVETHSDFRGLEKPSDHVPIVTEITL